LTTVIRCTQKLLKEIPDDLIDPSVSGERWHSNLLRIDRRKCVLFTHDASLYSVFVPGLKKPEFEHLDEVFGQGLFKALLWDEFSQAQIEQMLEAIRTIHFTRSSNRSVLGSMNDIRFHIEVNIEHAGGLEKVDFSDLHHRLNCIPFGAIGYRYPVEVLREHLTHVAE